MLFDLQFITELIFSINNATIKKNIFLDNDRLLVVNYEAQQESLQLATGYNFTGVYAILHGFDDVIKLDYKKTRQ